MNCLVCENLYVEFNDKAVLKNITVSIEKGKITCILGQNGCGKTTLLKAICGSVKLKSGQVTLYGKNIKKIKPRELSKTLSFLTQQRNLISDLKVEDLVRYGRYTHRKIFYRRNNEDEKIINWAMEKAKINHLRHRYLNNLSGGECQRVWIAMALAQKTEILILDEPTTFLDVSHQLEILQLVNELNLKENLTVIMVLHDINEAARYCDNAILMKNGEVYKQGEFTEIMDDYALNEVFNISAERIRHEDIKKEIYYPLKTIR